MVLLMFACSPLISQQSYHGSALPNMNELSVLNPSAGDGEQKELKRFNIGFKIGPEFPSEDLNDIYGMGLLWGTDLYWWTERDNGFKLSLDFIADKKETHTETKSGLSEIETDMEFSMFSLVVSGSFMHRFKDVHHVVPYLGCGLSAHNLFQNVDGRIRTVFPLNPAMNSSNRIDENDYMLGIGVIPVAGVDMRKLPLYAEIKYLTVAAILTDNIDFEKYGTFTITVGAKF